MYYGNKSIKELDDYYKIDTEPFIKYPWWKHKQCEKIQSAFNNHGIMLTLAECKMMYEIYSDEALCAGWENGLEDMSKKQIFKLLLPWLKNILNDREGRIHRLVEQLELNGYLED
ncbi:hypothetical protein ACFHWD_03290 [Clostridium sp. MT-14]|uniref:hypothetical protein n=1 Tax=Clostridium sp. MT-14 TaxID=3348360 RepID=UPI0035F40586